jgi:Dockerin type I domain/Thrombospondin type 3 repeat
MFLKSHLAAAALAALLASGAGAQAQPVDTDGDGIPDAIDNCSLVANTEQADFDNDGFGNVCDADINNDGRVNAVDLAILRSNFGKPGALGDLNGDGTVNALDLALLRRNFGKEPGPSGNGPNPPTSDGRNPPTAASLQVLKLTTALPDGRNAIVIADFGPFFANTEPGKRPPALFIRNNGDAAALLRQGFVPADLGKPNALGPRAGELVPLNDLGVLGDEKPGDGIYTGLAKVDEALMDDEASRFLARAREKKATRVVVFNGREAVQNLDFNPEDAFEPRGPERRFSFELPKLGRVELVAVPFPQLKLLLPPTTDPERTLLVRHPGVVQDPGRTFSPCSNNGAVAPIGNVNGAWSFKTLMSNMANTPATGITPQVFINDWLRLWMANANGVKHDDGVAVGFPVPARPALQAVIQSLQPGWNPANPATLDINRLPFRLLAIVNRIDLSESNYLGSGSPGELRFVFGLLERSAASAQCVPSREMTVILEYKVPTTSCTGLKMLANQWIGLDGLAPGSPAYNAQLQALTNQVSLPNAFPGRMNGSAIGQVRTNEVRLGLPWELREFTLQPSPVAGKLQHETVKNTPDPSFNRTKRLFDWIAGHSGETVPRQFQGADFIGTANRYGPGAFPANPAWNGLWDLPAPLPSIKNSTGTRFRFSLNTCSGCHLSETGTDFTMIKATGPLGAPAALSGFLTGTVVPDAEYGAPPLPGANHGFNDLWRRGQQLDQIAAKSCFLFPKLPLFQNLELLPPESLVQPESIFNPRFVH